MVGITLAVIVAVNSVVKRIQTRFVKSSKFHEDGKCMKYRVRQRGCSLTHSARTPPAVHQGITIWVDEIEFEKK